MVLVIHVSLKLICVFLIDHLTQQNVTDHSMYTHVYFTLKTAFSLTSEGIQETSNDRVCVLFQREDCLLVWQKMGTRDKMMYYFTMTFMTLGFIPAIGVILKMSFPKKEE